MRSSSSVLVLGMTTGARWAEMNIRETLVILTHHFHPLGTFSLNSAEQTTGNIQFCRREFFRGLNGERCVNSNSYLVPWWWAEKRPSTGESKMWAQGKDWTWAMSRLQDLLQHHASFGWRRQFPRPKPLVADQQWEATTTNQQSQTLWHAQTLICSEVAMLLGTHRQCKSREERSVASTTPPSTAPVVM